MKQLTLCFVVILLLTINHFSQSQKTAVAYFQSMEGGNHTGVLTLKVNGKNMDFQWGNETKFVRFWGNSRATQKGAELRVVYELGNGEYANLRSVTFTGRVLSEGNQLPNKKPVTTSRASSLIPIATAQRLLNQKINEPSADNMLLTCRACYSPDDKSDDDGFTVVSNYSNINQFLAKQGYIRAGRNGEYFTAKAKRSPHFEAYGDGSGGFGGAGFRFANFKNPKIMVTKITDLKNVPIEYDLVPTLVTIKYFGKTQRVKTTASFTKEGRKWNVCINCNR